MQVGSIQKPEQGCCVALLLLSRVVQSVSDTSSQSGSGPASGKESVPSGGALSLSSAQLGIWFAQKLNPSSAAYNIGEYIEVDGPLVLPLFERALRQVVSEAESLRLRFSEQAGEPTQFVGEPTAWSLPIIDVSSETDARAAAETWMKADLARPVDLLEGALFGFALFKASAERFFWYARYHHIVLDGFGMWVVARRVAAVYSGLCAGQAAEDGAFGSLAALLDEDADYLGSAQFTSDRQSWGDALASRPEPGSLTFSDRPSAYSASFLRETAYLPSSCEQALRALATRSRTNLARVMTAATALFLNRLTGTDDAVIGLPVASRGEATRCIPGMASNVLPLRVSLQPSMAVSELLAQTSRQIRAGLEHQRYQLANIRRDTGDIDARALFGLSINVMPFDYGFGFAGHRATAHNLSLGPVQDLNISVYDRSDGKPLRIDFDINPSLHNGSDLAVYRQRFLRLLAELEEAEADRPVGDFTILEPAERNTILRLWNDTARTNAQTTIPALFSEQAARTPHAAAVIFEGRRLTYAELDARANRLAHHLKNQGVKPETVVGLCAKRSPEMLIGLLGILKAGGAYLPLDADYPRDRLEFMLADAGVAFLVSSPELIDRLPVSAGIHVVRFNDDAIAREPAAAPALDLDPRHPAYVIYTSGSTGAPKAVVIEHASLTNKMLALHRDFDVDERFRAALLISSAFDPSIEQALLPLMGGGAVVVISDAVRESPLQFWEQVQRDGVTFISCVP